MLDIKKFENFDVSQCLILEASLLNKSQFKFPSSVAPCFVLNLSITLHNYLAYARLQTGIFALHGVYLNFVKNSKFMFSIFPFSKSSTHFEFKFPAL